MFEKIPEEIINNIFNYLVHPYNDNYYILSLVNKFSKNISLFFKNRMVCYICKKNKFYFLIRNGMYYSNNRSICKKHIYYCKYCKKNIDVYNYSYLYNSCINCKI